MSNEELDLLNEMKENCLKKGQYIDEKAKDKFNMLCHCEDFIIENYEQKQEIERLNKENKELKEQVVSAIRVNNIFTENKSIIELQAQRYEQELTITKEKQLKERIEYLERSNNRREDEILELRQENADLDNIINELEKWLNKEIKRLDEMQDTYDKYGKKKDANIIYISGAYNEVLDKLQELKGDGSNE